MNLVEELAVRYLDGDLSPEEEAELMRLVDEDETAARTCFSLFELEADLRANRVNSQLGDLTVQRLNQTLGERVRDNVIRKAKEEDARCQGSKRTRPGVGRAVSGSGRRRSRSGRRSFGAVWPYLAAVAAALLVVVGYFAHWAPTSDGTRIAEIVELPGGTVTLERGGGKRPARIGMEILKGDALTTDRHGVARVRWFATPAAHGARPRMEETFIRLGPNTRTTLSVAGNQAKRVSLDRGVISCDVARQPAGKPMVLTTPQGRAGVLGTKFRLFARFGTTQLEVVLGAVDLSGADGKGRATVRTGHYALAGGGLPIEPRPFDEMVVFGFALIDIGKDEPIAGHDPMADGAVLDLAALPTRRLAIVALTAPADVGSVEFELSRGDKKVHTTNEHTRPYALHGDVNREYTPWTPNPGAYRLTARPFRKRDREGQPGEPRTIRFRVVEGD